MNEIIYSDFDINISKNKLTNDVIKKKNTEAVKQALRLLFQTKYYDRVWRPTMGSYIADILFSQNDIVSFDLAKDEIRKIIHLYEPRVRIDAIDIQRNDIDAGEITIKVAYTILNPDIADTFVYVINRSR